MYFSDWEKESGWVLFLTDSSQLQSVLFGLRPYHHMSRLQCFYFTWIWALVLLSFFVLPRSCISHLIFQPHPPHSPHFYPTPNPNPPHPTQAKAIGLVALSAFSRRAGKKVRNIFIDTINNGGLSLLNELVIDASGNEIVAVMKLVADAENYPIGLFCTAGMLVFDVVRSVSVFWVFYCFHTVCDHLRYS